MPNTTVRAAAEGMPDINRRRLLLGLAAGSTAAVAAAAFTIIDATAAPSVADAIPATREKTSLDAMLLDLPPEEAQRLRLEILAIIAAVKTMCARGDDFQTIRNFVRTRCQQNQMDWKRERGI
ncbi:MAG: hypothetical protein EOR30_17245 [Mesorhizobium sp.]|uniref:hypothetical protein n=2 Tax=Mesorhizobium TaxID=68287 RepID=UPI000FC9B29B|nr:MULTISPECIES: hypothetical protein [unclassified Mesorhizobium]RUV75894.1 hypothetical protein EOA78_04610 [Mesorhizobium sp. M5C.F.Cr.IN.023.01.1.1]RWF85605.1 MAG: hypothetical protein EOQ36_21630 [Mesorhizobium sp.]RWF95316.1 MAG: hypothetical protein EOQ45_08310 [Mesorhizobium sp.]RWI39849.1 MAG: hypothetical protein EOR14_17340 [Mesorhizobium sp.]RWI45285.1 MAG: hypothetical protein EOR15_22700 [Mesorhizobium sp.]